MIANRPKQRVSISEKMKRASYQSNIHYYIGIATSTNNKKDTENNILAANGVIPTETYDYVLSALTGGNGTKNNLPGVIRNTDFITPIKEKNIGEFVELPSDFTVKVTDPDINILKNQEIGEIIRPHIEQAIINKINEQQDTGVPSAENVDIKKLSEDTLSKWIDTRADNVLKLVKSILYDNDFESKKLELYNNWWGTEEAYGVVETQNGAIFIDTISPLEGFPINNGYEFVEDQEAFMKIGKLTMDRIEEYYGDDLTTNDREYLDTLLNKNSDLGYSCTASVYEDIYGRKAFDDTGREYMPGDVLAFSSSRDVSEYVLYYRTEVERKILFYNNELGEMQHRVVEEDDFVFDEQQGHLAIEKEWISEVWKQVLLGEEYVGVYLKPTPLSVQLYDERGHNKLPVFGKKGILNGNVINPIPKRIVPSAALHRVITLQIERQIAKFKGTVEVIPQSMLQADAEGNSKAAMFYRLADNTIIFDDTKVDFNTANGYRLVGNDTASNFIKTLIDYRSTIKAEAWDMANMNDGRYGSAPASSTVTNNQQNIFNAKLGSVLSITMFNNMLVRLYTSIVNYCEYVYPNGVKGNSFNKDGDVAYFNIDSGLFTANKFGIHMSNAVIDHQKLKEWKDFAFAAGQHGEFELATAAIDGESVSGIRKKVDEYVTMKNEYEKQVKQQEQAQIKQIHDEEIAEKQADRDAKSNDIVTKEQMITDRELELAAVNNNNSVTNK